MICFDVGITHKISNMILFPHWLDLPLACHRKVDRRNPWTHYGKPCPAVAQGPGWMLAATGRSGPDAARPARRAFAVKFGSADDHRLINGHLGPGFSTLRHLHRCEKVKFSSVEGTWGTCHVSLTPSNEIKQGSSRNQGNQGQPQGPTTRFLMDKKTQKGQAQNIMIIPARWKWKLRTPSSNGSHYDLVESSPSMS